jgi:protein TonB
LVTESPVPSDAPVVPQAPPAPPTPAPKVDAPPAPPAPPAPKVADAGDVSKGYQDRFIKAAFSRAGQLFKSDIEGDCKVMITIDRNGVVVDRDLVKKSGSAAVDKLCMDSANTRYPPLGEEAKGSDYLRFGVPFSFKVKEEEEADE